MSAPATLILTRAEIAALMRPCDYLEAVEMGFRALQQGSAIMPSPLSIDGCDGAFHAKAARLSLERDYVALKLNGNFPNNPERHGLPTVQGVILLSDGITGVPLAILDSIEVTLRRTAAASALAARLFAKPDSNVLTLCGCGDQAWPHVEAMREVLPLTHGFCWDRNPARAQALAEQCAAQGFEMQPVEDFASATRKSDVIVTCTTTSQPYLGPEQIVAGTFIAAVGADSAHKSEIAPELMAQARVVTDSTDQCVAGVDLFHALAAGAMQRTDVYAEIGAVLCGDRPARTDQDALFLFDSTGTAVQDVASAAIIFERAVAAGAGISIQLAK